MFLSQADKAAKKLEHIKDINNKTIYTTELYIADILPYLDNDKLRIKNLDGYDIYSKESLYYLLIKDYKTSDIKYDNTDDKLFLIFKRDYKKYNLKYYNLIPVKTFDGYILCRAEPKEQ